jgi:hypothetical protein
MCSMTRLSRAEKRRRIESIEPLYIDKNICILDPISRHGVVVRTMVSADKYKDIMEQGLLSQTAQVELGIRSQTSGVFPDLVYFRAPFCVAKVQPTKSVSARIREEINAQYGPQPTLKQFKFVFIRVDPDRTRVFFSEINSNFDITKDEKMRMHKKCILNVSTYMKLVESQRQQKHSDGEAYWNLDQDGDMQYSPYPECFPWNKYNIERHSEIWALHRVDPSCFVKVIQR